MVTTGPASFDVNQRKYNVILRVVLSRSRLNRCQNKRLAFPNSAGFLSASLASVISLFFSKTGALEVFATLTRAIRHNELVVLPRRSPEAQFAIFRGEYSKLGRNPFNQNFRAEVRKFLCVEWIATGSKGLVPFHSQNEFPAHLQHCKMKDVGSLWLVLS